VKRLIVLAALMLALTRFVLSSIADTSTFLADTNVPANQVTSSISEANNSSAGAIITIRMCNMPEEWLSQVHLRSRANWKAGH